MSIVVMLYLTMLVACVDKAPEPNNPNTPDNPVEGEMVNMVITRDHLLQMIFMKVQVGDNF